MVHIKKIFKNKNQYSNIAYESPEEAEFRASFGDQHLSQITALLLIPLPLSPHSFGTRSPSYFPSKMFILMVGVGLRARMEGGPRLYQELTPSR